MSKRRQYKVESEREENGRRYCDEHGGSWIDSYVKDDGTFVRGYCIVNGYIIYDTEKERIANTSDPTEEERKMMCGPGEEWVKPTDYLARDGITEVFRKGYCRKIPKDRQRVFGFRSEREMMDHVKKLKERK